MTFSSKWLAALTIPVLCWIVGVSAQPRNSGIETYKQYALALYTVSLSDRRQLSSYAIILLANDQSRYLIDEVAIDLDGSPLVRFSYKESATPPLGAHSAHHHGFFRIPAGAHRIQARALIRDADSKDKATQWVEFDTQLTLDEVARGFSLRLRLKDLRQRPFLSLATPLPARDLLAAAQLEATNNRPGRAVTMLQTLARVDPVMSDSPPAALLMGRSLRDWGLAMPAEQVFANIARRTSRDDPAHAQSRINAAELALERGAPEVAAKRLFAPDLPMNADLRQRAAALEAQVLLARGQLQYALERAPDSGSQLWTYNTAVALHQAGKRDDAELALARILKAPTPQETSAIVRDTAGMKLGYRLLARGQAAQAYQVFGEVSAQGTVVSQALLGRGWAAVAELAGRAEVVEDGVRPGFIHRIETAVQQIKSADPVAQQASRRAMMAAIEAWLPLVNFDPVDPSVQEGLVALQFARQVLGEWQAAIQHGQSVVQRLEEVSKALSAAAHLARSGSSIDLSRISTDTWPPASGAWRHWLPAKNWWRNPDASPPPNLYARRLLLEPEVLNLIESMSGLRDAEVMAQTAGADPDLSARSAQLLEQIAEERVIRQQQINQFAAGWCDTHAAHARQYLVMARMLLAQAYEQGHMQ